MHFGVPLFLETPIYPISQGGPRCFNVTPMSQQAISTGDDRSDHMLPIMLKWHYPKNPNPFLEWYEGFQSHHQDISGES